jgi:cytochrome P450 family 109
MSTRKKLPIPQIGAGYCPEMGTTPESRAQWFRQMREKQPVRYRADPGFWEVFRYEDVEQVLKDYHAFSVEYTRRPGRPNFDGIGNTDPPRHRQLRSLVSQVFSARHIAELAPRISTIADELLDPVLADGAMDFAQQFAFPFTVRVLAELLGIPQEDYQLFQRWAYQLVDLLPHPDDPDHSELGAYLSAQIAQQAKEPRGGLISSLLQASLDGEQLSPEHIASICEGLLLSGSVPPAALLNAVIGRFNQKPEIYAELRHDPVLIPGAIEEVLRHDVPSNQPRLVKQKTTLYGQKINEGEVILAWMGSANFDETHFTDPDHFDIRRAPNPHLTFGYGIHTCLGAPLVRMEGKITLEKLLASTQDIRSDPNKPIEYLDPRIGLIYRLPILFTSSH